MTDELAGKRIMLFIPSEDKEYNNVYFVTTENKVYKAKFSSLKKKAELVNHLAFFSDYEINLKSLEGKSFEDFK